MSKPLSDLIIWGGTGNFKVLCELLKTQFRIAGYFDNNPDIPKEYRGIPCLGNRAAFLDWVRQFDGTEKPSFIVSIGPGYGQVRLDVHDEIKSFGLHPITAVHRTAFVAENARLGEGSQVYANGAVCVDAQVGRACIINTGASVDHECVLGDGVSVGPGARLAGLVQVGKNADIYTGAVVLPRIRIGAGAIVGAGAVVLKDVPDFTVVAGNPARIIKERRE